jgi:hypothetical protein
MIKNTRSMQNDELSSSLMTPCLFALLDEDISDQETESAWEKVCLYLTKLFFAKTRHLWCGWMKYDYTTLMQM